MVRAPPVVIPYREMSIGLLEENIAEIPSHAYRKYVAQALSQAGEYAEQLDLATELQRQGRKKMLVMDDGAPDHILQLSQADPEPNDAS